MLSRRAMLKRITPLKRGAGFKPWRQSIEQAEWRRKYLASHQACQGPTYMRTDVGCTELQLLQRAKAAGRCLGIATELHEKKKRSRGGSPIDAANVVPLCRRCHEFTERYPVLATKLGLLIPSWQGQS